MDILIIFLCICNCCVSGFIAFMLKQIYDYEMDFNTDFVSYCKHHDEDDFLDFKER